MAKKYHVHLSEAERTQCDTVIGTLSGSSQKVRRAYILRQADCQGPGWPDEQIAAAYHCRVQTVENLRKRLVCEGFEVALNGKPRERPPRQPKLDGEGEARLLAMRLGPPPEGFGTWTLSLLADQLVALEVVDSICPETVRKVLKKTA